MCFKKPHRSLVFSCLPIPSLGSSWRFSSFMYLIFLFGFLGGTFGISAQSIRPGDSNPNLIVQPGFERGRLGLFSAAHNGTLTVVSGHGFSGTYALRHVATQADSFTIPYRGSGAGVASASANEAFQFSVMVKASADTSVQLRIFALDGSLVPIDHGLADVTADSSWQRLTLTYRCPAGTEQVGIRLDNDGGPGSTVWWDDLYLVRATNDAEFQSQLVPATMGQGTAQTVSITMKNTGTTVWTAAEGYRLGAASQQLGIQWGVGRALLEDDDAIFPNQSKTFSFSVQAPATFGNFDFQWRMLREAVAWFGQRSDLLNVSVEDTGAPKLVDVSVSEGSWQPNGSQTYEITVTADDSGGAIRRVSALVNYQGGNSAHPRGRFIWDADAYVTGVDQVTSSGGGFASKDGQNYNPEMITLVGCSTQQVGTQRIVTFTVRPEINFGVFAENDISGLARDAAGNTSGWVNFNLNFSTQAPGNLLENPGFEDGSTAPFVGGAVRGTLSIETDPNLVHDGQFALKHLATDTWSFTSPWDGVNLAFYPEEDTTFRFSGWVRAD